MDKRQIGNSDLYVSQVGLGCMSLGTDEQKAEYIIDEALDSGINYLDTADLYDLGKNEEIVGKALKGKRDRVILATKVGNHFNHQNGDWFWDPSKKYIKSEVKESLRRLGTEYIDLYQLHGGTIDDPIDETIEAFEELKQEGVIRYYGISSIRPNVIREYIERSSIVSVMMQYSLLDRRPEEKILDLLHENNISVLARGPLAKGMLSDQAHEKVASKGKDGYLDYSLEELQAITERLKAYSGADRTRTALALQYVLQHPAVAAAVFGASSSRQLQDNLSIQTAEPLTAEDVNNLKSISKPIHYAQHR
ncbi:aldo/keto reductase [Sediminibacillus dalangtanensis]|uniref:Aldo/keto reductase n=1 Tax=Sediminibacillus dalangtanensis TaxID=2729421 RepID=A0ABX7VS08_9BACI|nr:aldo/keto reductase [Sediminibacillus dalangtanensis]QTM99724.1 aldo/keto reductase [Sediminibacillus dalangtanensis]